MRSQKEGQQHVFFFYPFFFNGGRKGKEETVAVLKKKGRGLGGCREGTGRGRRGGGLGEVNKEEGARREVGVRREGGTRREGRGEEWREAGDPGGRGKEGGGKQGTREGRE